MERKRAEVVTWSDEVPWLKRPIELKVDRVAVLGLGFMGGSLCRSLTASGRYQVSGWSPEPEERRLATSSGAVVRAPRCWSTAVAGADLIVFATPIEAAVNLLKEVSSAATAEATFTDTVSLKVPVMEAAVHAGLGDRWVGSHPMAGSEESGFGNSLPDLYRDSPVWIVTGSASVRHVHMVNRMWRTAGAEPREIEAAPHDHLMALVSHLPQLASNALALTLAELGVAHGDLGSGGRGATRLSGSSSTMWRGLLARTPPVLTSALGLYATHLTRIAEMLSDGRIEELSAMMDATAAWRKRA